jgi:RNA polymerase sigma-70 factor (ECF subfamily)
MPRLRASRLEAPPQSGPRNAPPESVADGDLVVRARKGDSWAEEALFRRHVDYISALSLRLLRERAESEDVVQEAFLDAFAQLRRGATPDSFRSWLAGIAVHKVHRRFRRRKLFALLGRQACASEGVLQSMAQSGTSPELCTELGLLDLALGALGENDRAAWVLRYVEGYALEEVAILCRCSLATAKRRINKARVVVNAHVEVDEVADE